MSIGAAKIKVGDVDDAKRYFKERARSARARSNISQKEDEAIHYWVGERC
jgi:hypothetical protein